MKFRKFVGKDMSEVYKKISEAVGKDALIVETRYVQQPGFFGKFKPKMVEVLTGIETTQQTMNGPVNGGRRLSPPQGPVMQSRALQTYQKPVNAEASKVEMPPMDLSTAGISAKNISQSSPQGLTQEDLKAEVEDLMQTPAKPVQTYSKFPSKTQVEELKSRMSSSENADQRNVSALENEMKEIRRLLTHLSTTPKVVTPTADGEWTYEQQFQELFADYEFSKSVQQGFKGYLIKEGIEAKDATLEHLKIFIEQEINRVVPISSLEETSPIHVFVGPPGVGKTTTIAKIASNEILNHQRKVGLITVDTYRIGAVEQLKTYAELLNAPIKVVYSPEEMMQAVKELEEAGCDKIIVDSIGRSHRDQGNLEDLNKLINPLETKNVYLVLNMSTKYRELLKIMDNFKFMNYQQFVFTKLDESERNENILNICYETAYPVAFLCTGQEVPRDIERPTPERLMEFVWGGTTNE